MKTCSKCKTKKPRSDFGKHSAMRDGLENRCKACCIIANAKWRAENKDKVKARHAKYRAANPDKRKADSANWYTTNPEARRINSHNRRARERSNGGKLSHGLAAKLFKLQRGKCACCRISIADGNHLDHVVPVALGGPNEDWNMQLLCGPCNLSKHAKHPVDFMQSRGFLL